jgi:motility quorum-sensing regulator/GCU-specific mRNA interferase toxin
LQVGSSSSYGAGRQRSLNIFGAVILAMTTADFYKSMTSHADHQDWQDVYRPTTPAGEVYLKLTIIDEVLIVSFKEL